MEPISRRSFIAGVCAVVALGGSEVPAAANTAVKKLPGGRLSVDLKAVPAFAKVGGATKIGSVKGVPVAIARTEKGWVCNAHGSEFEADGDLVLGPATTGLARVPMKISKGVATVG